MRYLYTIVFYLALPFVFLRLLWRSRRSADYRRRWAERLGFCPFQLEKSIWIHAASVGETIAAVPLIKSLQATYPNLPIVLTNMTVTGGLRAKALFGESIYQTYIPYDLPDAANRFLKRTNPQLALIIETELWPNIFSSCEQRNIPIVIANARLSEKSARGYQRVAPVTKQMLNAVTQLLVQTEVEAERFINLGLPAERSTVTGSIKFDVDVANDLPAKQQALRKDLGAERLIWVVASTHATEEEIILTAQKKILAKFPQALLILVPRHPERFDSVFALAQQEFQAVRRSKAERVEATTQVYLGDTMGELLLFYGVSDVAFIGGSFAPVGGHNMLEAALFGKPILTGPQLFNFAEISQKLIATKGMQVVNNADELAAEICHLFADPIYRNTMGQNAKRFMDNNRGALAKHLDVIHSMLV